MNSAHSSQGIGLIFMKKHFTAVAILLAITSCLLFFKYKEEKTEFKSTTVTLSLKDYLLNSFLAELPDINKKLPYVIDDKTILLNVEYKDEKIIHLYELKKYQKNKFSEDKILQKMALVLKEQACFDPIRKNMLAAGIDFLNVYRDSAGQLAFEISINQSDCNDIHSASRVSS
jgi:hypothetical protein